jgi:glycosyltransferase involved in cell wall biosynthesis
VKVSVLIGTYGEDSWAELARERALPSVAEADEVLLRHEPAATIAEVRNALAEEATSDWLCFLDADDQFGSNYLRFMRRALERRRGVDRVPPLLTPAVSYVRKGRQQTPRFHVGNDLSKNNYLVVGTLVHRELFLSVGGFGDYPHGFEDWSLWAKCWKAGAEVVQVRRAVYIAYWNENSKHREAWRDRDWQVKMHEQVQRDLFPEQYA